MSSNIATSTQSRSITTVDLAPGARVYDNRKQSVRREPINHQQRSFFIIFYLFILSFFHHFLLLFTGTGE